MLNMNFVSCYLCCRAALRASGTPGGRIVNVAARPGMEPRLGAGMAAYAASKAAVAAFTQALAAEVGGRGVLVNAVAPSIIDTPANRAAMPEADHAAWPKPEEIAATIAFLASPANQVSTSGRDRACLRPHLTAIASRSSLPDTQTWRRGADRRRHRGPAGRFRRVIFF